MDSLAEDLREQHSCTMVVDASSDGAIIKMIVTTFMAVVAGMALMYFVLGWHQPTVQPPRQDDRNATLRAMETEIEKSRQHMAAEMKELESRREQLAEMKRADAEEKRQLLSLRRTMSSSTAQTSAQKRSVKTQSPTTFKMRLTQPRFQPLGPSEHGGWSE